MHLYLIRHGNMAGDPHAHFRPPVEGCLSEQGCKQVERLVQDMNGLRLTHVVASPLGRALQTAQGLAIPRGLEIQVEPWLEEWRPASVMGEEADTRYETILLRSGELSPEQSWKTGNGESLMQMADRMIPGLLSLLSGWGVEAGHGGYLMEEEAEDYRIALVAHGGTLNVLMMFLLGLPIRPGHPFRFEETGVARITFEPTLGVWYPSLRLFPLQSFKESV